MGARLTTAPRVSPRAFERGSVSLAVSTKDKALTFSLAMPSRNMAPYIGSAVRSLLDQPGVNVELLIQDACSTDTTSEVLDAHSDSRVKVFREEDSGPADAINRGLSKAKGDIFGWLNADDELEPGALSKVIRVFEDEPAVELVYGRGFYVDEEGVRLKPYDVRPFDRNLLRTRDFILQPAAFWRRSLWERVGPLNPTLAWVFDWEWFIRASNETSFRFLSDDLARFRLTGENKSLVGGDERHAELAAVAKRYGGALQPTYLYWRFAMLKRRLPILQPFESLLWRLFPGRINT